MSVDRISSQSCCCQKPRERLSHQLYGPKNHFRAHDFFPLAQANFRYAVVKRNLTPSFVRLSSPVRSLDKIARSHRGIGARSAECLWRQGATALRQRMLRVNNMCNVLKYHRGFMPETWHLRPVHTERAWMWHETLGSTLHSREQDRKPNA